jgi:GntR family transcriptional regulator
MVDYGSHLPPFQQIAAILRSQIESGELSPHARLPSIAGLMQEYGVARATAQKTLKLLVAEGYAEVEKGWGTFVTEDPPSR